MMCGAGLLPVETHVILVSVSTLMSDSVEAVTPLGCTGNWNISGNEL